MGGGAVNTSPDLIKENLHAVFLEMADQPAVGASYPPNQADFGGHMGLLREWIEDHREYGLAYESIVEALETLPFRLSGAAAVKLLEVGLLFGFKTERHQDARFDVRSKP
jgi:hypothetical protein